jgi:hypothetical protein
MDRHLQNRRVNLSIFMKNDPGPPIDGIRETLWGCIAGLLQELAEFRKIIEALLRNSKRA